MAIKKDVEGFVYNANSFKIMRGQDAQLILHLFNPDYSPMSLLSFSSCETRLKNQDDSILLCGNTHHTVMNVEPGIIRLALSASETANLKVGTDQPIEVTVCSTAYGATTKKLVWIGGALTVIKSMTDV